MNINEAEKEILANCFRASKTINPFPLLGAKAAVCSTIIRAAIANLVERDMITEYDWEFYMTLKQKIAYTRLQKPWKTSRQRKPNQKEYL